MAFSYICMDPSRLFALFSSIAFLISTYGFSSSLLPLPLLPPPVGVSGTGVGDAIAATLADMSVSDILMSFNVSFCGDVDPDVRSEAYPGDGEGDVE